MVVNELVSAELAFATSDQSRGNDRSAWWVREIARRRFQLAGGFLAAVGAPMAIRALHDPGYGPLLGRDTSALGTLAALLLGFVIFRKLTAFPGVRASGYILPAFTAAYVIVFAAFFLLRLDYSRMQFLSSLMLTSAFFYCVFFVIRRVQRMEIAIVPGGDAARLKALKFVTWRTPTTPDDLKVSGPIVADFKADLTPEWERFIADATLAGQRVYDAKHVLESLSGKVQIDHISENTFGSLSPDQIYAPAKHYVDRAFALMALALAGPILLIIAIAIRLDSPGPALFRQERMGYRGKPFTLLKFRTMRVAAPETEKLEDQMTRDGDRRITRLGRFLRRSRLDELPQIFNIIRGEMSWIGPRPEAMKLSKWYEELIPFYRYRHVVRPGITGWAQVNQGHVTSLDDAKLKLQYDFFYVKNFSLWLDLLVLLRTVRVVLTGSGAR